MEDLVEFLHVLLEEMEDLVVVQVPQQDLVIHLLQIHLKEIMVLQDQVHHNHFVEVVEEVQMLLLLELVVVLVYLIILIIHAQHTLVVEAVEDITAAEDLVEQVVVVQEQKMLMQLLEQIILVEVEVLLVDPLLAQQELEEQVDQALLLSVHLVLQHLQFHLAQTQLQLIQVELKLQHLQYQEH